PSDEIALDGYEGVIRSFYTKTTLPIHAPQGNTRQAMVYIASNNTPGPPARGYLVKILTGARAFKLPAAYQDFLKRFQNHS
ncbi:MAG TPA: gamma-glutamylcyclotransferase, partial [Opitutae bacterium]|nr:gamma-glutamylcyclotransferase [Opitutae bacterium]